MSYQLRAVVADADLLRQRVTELDLDHAVLAALRQDMALLPVTTELVEELTGALPDFATTEPSLTQPFQLVLSPALTAVFANWSRYGPIGYLEAEFHAGVGYQSAVTWLAGTTCWGPHFDDEFTGPRHHWPVNAALARLGAEPGDRIDLFAEVGLDVHRDTAGWLSHGRRGLPPDYFDELAVEWEVEWEAGRSLTGPTRQAERRVVHMFYPQVVDAGDRKSSHQFSGSDSDE